jgi:hypothetical protein
MTIYEESGLRLDLPDGAHLRLAATAAYRPLSGQHLKEMDFGWLHDDRLVLLELRDYTTTTLPLSGTDLVPDKDLPSPHRFDDLVSKLTDTLLMLAACWAGTDWGQKLQAELPEAAKQPLKLVLAIGLDLPLHLRVHLPGLRAALNARMKGRMQLLGIEAVAVLHYDTLLQRSTFSPYIQRLPG